MKSKVLKRIIIVAILIYAVYTFISQQKLLNTYTAEAEAYNTKIEEAKETSQELADTKEHLNSKEYIEDIAREKLDMYLPNEKVYIDISK
jgi:cell division protein DivIC